MCERYTPHSTPLQNGMSVCIHSRRCVLISCLHGLGKIRCLHISTYVSNTREDKSWTATESGRHTVSH